MSSQVYHVLLAGNMMLNTCPRFEGCGTRYPMWTDDAMPTTVGKSSRITAYAVGSNNDCRHKYLMRPMDVIRCSWNNNHDFIYRNAGNILSRDCLFGFCGMTAE